VERIRIFLLLEAITFILAALVHSGVLIDGYEHDDARIAESIIAIALLVGLAFTWIRPGATRTAGIAAQGFALLGTFVGLFTIIIAVGPRTAPDVIYHLGIIAVLIWGLAVAVQLPSSATARRQMPDHE
jgi:hypothetical protein